MLKYWGLPAVSSCTAESQATWSLFLTCCSSCFLSSSTPRSISPVILPELWKEVKWMAIGDSAWKTVSLLYLTLSDKHPPENKYKEAMSEQRERERAGVNKLWDSCVFALVCLKIFVFFISDTGVMIWAGTLVLCKGNMTWGALGVSLGCPVTSHSIVLKGLRKYGRTDSFRTWVMRTWSDWYLSLLLFPRYRPS